MVKNLDLNYNTLTNAWISHICAFCIINVLGIISTTVSFVNSKSHEHITKVLNTFPELNLTFNNMKDLILEKRD